MKRKDFLASLGLLAGAAFVTNPKPKKLSLAKHTSNADMGIGVNGVERMRIYSNGNISIATTSPNYKLTINN